MEIILNFRFILVLHSSLGGKEEEYIRNDNKMIYGPFSQIKLMTRHNDNHWHNISGWHTFFPDVMILPLFEKQILLGIFCKFCF